MVSHADLLAAVAVIVASMIGATATVVSVALGNRRRNSAENLEIHLLVDGQLASVKETLAAAITEIRGLRAEIQKATGSPPTTETH